MAIMDLTNVKFIVTTTNIIKCNLIKRETEGDFTYTEEKVV